MEDEYCLFWFAFHCFIGIPRDGIICEGKKFMKLVKFMKFAKERSLEDRNTQDQKAASPQLLVRTMCCLVERQKRKQLCVEEKRGERKDKGIDLLPSNPLL